MQRVDFFDWTPQQADRIVELLLSVELLEDYECIEGADGICSGFIEFIGIDASEIEYLCEHWEDVIYVEYDPDSCSLTYAQMEFEEFDEFDEDAPLDAQDYTLEALMLDTESIQRILEHAKTYQDDNDDNDK